MLVSLLKQQHGLQQASATYGMRAKRGAKRGTWNDFQWHAE